MKSSSIPLLISGITLLYTCTARAQPTQPSVDTILQRYYEAVGGLDKIASIQATKTMASVSGPGMDMPAVFYQKRPNKLRTEVTVQGMTMVQAYDGTNAWAIIPFTGSSAPQDIPEAEAVTMKEQADIDGILVDYKKKGYSIDLVGTEKIGEIAAYRLKVTNRDGRQSFYLIDTEHYLPVQIESTVTQNGTEAQAVTTLGDYRPEGGVLMPHIVKQSLNNQPVAQITFTHIEINPQIADSIFDRPVK